MSARAILLLPSGMRAYDEDFTVALPLPATIHLGCADTFTLVHVHHAGQIDGDTRGLYVLGGQYHPCGYGDERLAPEEANDQ